MPTSGPVPSRTASEEPVSPPHDGQINGISPFVSSFTTLLPDPVPLAFASVDPFATATPPALKPKTSRAKLRKQRRPNGADTGDESDGGYVSDAARSRKNLKPPPPIRTPAAQDAEDSDGGYLSSVSTKTKYAKTNKKKEKPTSSSPPGDESDGGYLSEASKKKRTLPSFFRRKPKQPTATGQPSLSPHADEPSVPPVPRPPMPLPIALRFARAAAESPFFEERPGTATSSYTGASVDDSSSTRPSMDSLQTPITAGPGVTLRSFSETSTAEPSVDSHSYTRDDDEDDSPARGSTPQPIRPEDIMRGPTPLALRPEDIVRRPKQQKGASKQQRLGRPDPALLAAAGLPPASPIPPSPPPSRGTTPVPGQLRGPDPPPPQQPGSRVRAPSNAAQDFAFKTWRFPATAQQDSPVAPPRATPFVVVRARSSDSLANPVVSHSQVLVQQSPGASSLSQRSSPSPTPSSAFLVPSRGPSPLPPSSTRSPAERAPIADVSPLTPRSPSLSPSITPSSAFLAPSPSSDGLSQAPPTDYLVPSPSRSPVSPIKRLTLVLKAGASPQPPSRPGIVDRTATSPHQGYERAGTSLNPISRAQLRVDTRLSSSPSLSPSASVGHQQSSPLRPSRSPSTQYATGLPGGPPSRTGLVQYDLPPPSPPPTGPLPRPPPTAGGDRWKQSPTSGGTPPVGNLRVSPSLNSLRPTPPAGVGLGIADVAAKIPRRGQASPFPVRPVQSNATPLRRVVSSSHRPPTNPVRLSPVNVDGPSRQSFASGSTESEGSGDEEILDVLARFRRTEEFKSTNGSMLRPTLREDDEEDPPYARTSYWADDDDQDDASRYSFADTTRLSTWSTATGKAGGALNEQASGEARDRFLARVKGIVEKEGRQFGASSPTPSKLGPQSGGSPVTTTRAGGSPMIPRAGETLMGPPVKQGPGWAMGRGTGMGAGERI